MRNFDAFHRQLVEVAKSQRDRAHGTRSFQAAVQAWSLAHGRVRFSGKGNKSIQTPGFEQRLHGSLYSPSAIAAPRSNDSSSG